MPRYAGDRRMSDRRPTGEDPGSGLTIRVQPLLGWMIALALTLVAGFALGRGVAAAERARRVRSQACPYTLPLEYRYFALGRGCPVPGCSTPLLDCHHTEAHEVKKAILDMISRGVHPDSIRALVARRCPLAASQPGPGLESVVPDSGRAGASGRGAVGRPQDESATPARGGDRV